MEIMQINNRYLEYEIQGTGIPFVFLHGLGGSIRQIYNIYEPVPDVQLITLNQQGHGNSEPDWTHYTFDALADDVITLLDYLRIPKAYMGGISMGAAVSLNVAVRYPNRVISLLLIRNAWTPHGMSDEVQRAYYDLGTSLSFGNIQHFYHTKGWELVKAPSSYTRNTFLCTFEDPSSLKYWQKYQFLPKERPIGSAEELNNLTLPVFIVANRNDFCHPFFYGEYFHRHIRNSCFTEIPDKDQDTSGHKAGVNQSIRLLLHYA